MTEPKQDSVWLTDLRNRRKGHQDRAFSEMAVALNAYATALSKALPFLPKDLEQSDMELEWEEMGSFYRLKVHLWGGEVTAEVDVPGPIQHGSHLNGCDCEPDSVPVDLLDTQDILKNVVLFEDYTELLKHIDRMAEAVSSWKSV